MDDPKNSDPYVSEAIVLDSQTGGPITSDLSGHSDSSGSPNQGTVLVEMEGMIKNYIASIDKLQAEVKKQKEMLDDIFNNDPTYQQQAEAAKQAGKIKAQTRAEILKRVQAKELNERIKSMRSEAKEQQGALSDYLQEYQRISGVNEIEGEDGEIREIVYVAKLIKKSFKF